MEGKALAEVIRRAQRGDPAAFENLVEQFAGRIYGFLYRMSGSRPDAEDLMQEVFVRVVRMIGEYQHDGRFEAWLFRIAANLGRDRVRRARRTPRQVELNDGPEGNGRYAGAGSLEEAAGQAAGPDAGLIHEEECEALQRALLALPEAERTVIMLRHFSQMSFKEIAEAMATPLGTALARAHRALARLRHLMNVPGAAGRGMKSEAAPAGEESPS
jgi:RNA polymerase sigma-70 factor (ECF subfamily)